MCFCINNICMFVEFLENLVILFIIIILCCLMKYRLKLLFGVEVNVCIFKIIISKFIEYI